MRFACSPRRLLLPRLALLIAAGLAAAPLRAQSPDSPRAAHFTHSFAIFTEYSPDSSPIILGDSGQRKLVTLGATYSLPLVQKRLWQFSWAPEIRPIIAESDPVETGYNYSICVPLTLAAIGQPCTPQSGYAHYPHKIPVIHTGRRTEDNTFTFYGQTYYDDFTLFYGRRWTYAAGISPVSFRAAFLPQRRLQPILGFTGGFIVSPRDIPIFDSSAFNFTFSFGGGFQFWRTPTHAMLIEYRIHHLSNADIGAVNPGVDSQIIHVGYVWGRR